MFYVNNTNTMDNKSLAQQLTSIEFKLALVKSNLFSKEGMSENYREISLVLDQLTEFKKNNFPVENKQINSAMPIQLENKRINSVVPNE